MELELFEGERGRTKKEKVSAWERMKKQKERDDEVNEVVDGIVREVENEEWEKFDEQEDLSEEKKVGEKETIDFFKDLELFNGMNQSNQLVKHTA